MTWLTDDEQDTADLCERCLIAWDLHPSRTGTLQDCLRAIAQEDAEVTTASPPEEVEHVTLVAIVTTGADAEEAQQVLVDHMPSAGKYGLPPGWDSWWVADDTLGHTRHDVRRIDGSDNDSAVFCNRRAQARSARMLYALGLTEECNADLTVGPQRRLAEVLDGMVSLALEADRLRREIGGEA